MTIYFFVLGLLAILAAYPHQKSVKLQAILAVLLLVIFGGLRYKVGTDWYSYEHSFDAVNAGLPSSDFREEKGFLGLMSIVSYFGGTYGNFIFMLFTLSLAVKLLAVKSFKANINIALLVYFSAIFMIYDVNGLRQGLAMGLVLIAGFAAYQRRAILFACIIGIASSVHIVSLIGLMIYPMINPIFYKTSVPIRILLLMIGGIASFFLSKVILLYRYSENNL